MAEPITKKEKVKILEVKQALGQNQEPKTWTSQKGTVFKIMNVVLSDLREGQWLWNQKPTDELKPGMEVELEIKEEQYNGFPQLKFRYESPGSNNNFQKKSYGKSPEEIQQIIRQNALSHATKLICDNLNVSTAVKGKERETIFTLADQMVHYINTGKKPEIKPNV